MQKIRPSRLGLLGGFRPNCRPAKSGFCAAAESRQDGLVSRFINRPISRAISRALLKTSITPSAWTLAIFVLPLAGAAFLARGDYASVIAGLLVFQCYSILDGCDGEIARAKYLESSRGGELDTWCDNLGTMLLLLSCGSRAFTPIGSDIVSLG